jgi:hypothetical protein
MPTVVLSKERNHLMTPMFASIRKYNNAPLLVDELLKKQDDIKSVLRPVPGFQAYYLLKTTDGAVSVTVCESKAGVDESNRVEATWLKDKLPTFANRAPEITSGEVRFHLNGQLNTINA